MHSLSRTEVVIKKYCIGATGTDPVTIALELMQRPEIRLHGPEHHFLTAAVLMAAYCNVTGIDLNEKLEKLQKRCEMIPAGVCGYYGICGDVMAAGAFMSVLLGTTYLSRSEWTLTGIMTARCQTEMAKLSGPRCCKSATISVLITAVDVIQDILNVRLDKPGMILCSHSGSNIDCLGIKCIYNDQNVVNRQI